MDMIARYVGMDDEELIRTWSVNRFYTKVKYLAWKAYDQKKYQEIMSKKK